MILYGNIICAKRPDIQTDWPIITEVKLNCYLFHKIKVNDTKQCLCYHVFYNYIRLFNCILKNSKYIYTYIIYTTVGFTSAIHGCHTVIFNICTTGCEKSLKINWLELHMYACLLKCRFYNKILREKSFISESIPGNNSTK